MKTVTDKIKLLRLRIAINKLVLQIKFRTRFNYYKYKLWYKIKYSLPSWL